MVLAHAAQGSPTRLVDRDELAKLAPAIGRTIARLAPVMTRKGNLTN